MRVIVAREPGGPEVLEPAEVPRPAPGPGEVLIEVTAAGVNRADLLQRQGRYPPPPGASEVIGLEVSGRVSALGPGVQEWAVGTPCVALLAGGGYAEFAAVPVGQVLPPPPGIDLIAAAGVIEVAATVVSNLDAAALTRGRDVAGARRGGRDRVVRDPVRQEPRRHRGHHRREPAQARLLPQHRCGPRPVLPRGLAGGGRSTITGRRGVDVILDNMGAPYLEDHVRLLAPHGRLVVIGLQGGRRATLDLGTLLSRWGSVSATTLRSRPAAEKAAICARVQAQIWPLLGDRTIVLPPQTRFPLADAARAHAHLESGDNLGKVVLTVSGP